MTTTNHRLGTAEASATSYTAGAGPLPLLHAKAAPAAVTHGRETGRRFGRWSLQGNLSFTFSFSAKVNVGPDSMEELGAIAPASSVNHAGGTGSPISFPPTDKPAETMVELPPAIQTDNDEAVSLGRIALRLGFVAFVLGLTVALIVTGGWSVATVTAVLGAGAALALDILRSAKA